MTRPISSESCTTRLGFSVLTAVSTAPIFRSRRSGRIIPRLSMLSVAPQTIWAPASSGQFSTTPPRGSTGSDEGEGMTHQAIRQQFHELIDVAAPVRQIGTGFTFTEGPVWHPVERHLLFSDMPADTRRRWDGTRVTEVTRASNKGNGMTYDAGLDLL